MHPWMKTFVLIGDVSTMGMWFDVLFSNVSVMCVGSVKLCGVHGQCECLCEWLLSSTASRMLNCETTHTNHEHSDTHIDVFIRRTGGIALIMTAACVCSTPSDSKRWVKNTYIRKQTTNYTIGFITTLLWIATSEILINFRWRFTIFKPMAQSVFIIFYQLLKYQSLNP